VESFEVMLKKLEVRKRERLEKGSEFYKIMAGVFDTSTLLALYHLINRGAFDLFYGVVSTGKEANIFCATDKTGNYVAVKIYRIATSNFKHMYKYLAGDPRFYGIRKGRRKVIYSWASREFKNLKVAHAAGVNVPKPVNHEKNVLVTEFVGEEGVPYPMLKDVRPDDPEAIFEELFREVKLLYSKAGLVHGDLSEYNVLVTPEPVLIDFSIGTNIENPMAHELLMHDLSTLSKYFGKFGIKTPPPSQLFEEVLGSPQKV
jgi:RIO kinase 1